MAGDSLKDFFIRVFLDVDKASIGQAEANVRGFGTRMRAAASAFAFNEVRDAVGSLIGLGQRAASSINEVATKADSVGDLADNLGIAAQQLQFWSFAAEEGGGSAEGMSQAMRVLSRNVNEAASGSKEAQKAFAALGVGTNGKNAGQVFEEVTAALLAETDASKQAALAQSVFGRSWMDVQAAIKQGPEGLAALRSEFEGLGLAFTPEDLALVDSYDKSVRRVSATWEAFKLRALEPVIKGLDQAFRGLLNWYRANQGGITAFSQQSFKALTDVLKSFYEIGIKPAIAGAKAIYDQFDKFSSSTGVWKGLIDELGKGLALAFVSPKAALADFLVNGLRDLKDFSTGDAPSALGFLRHNWKKILDDMRADGQDFAADTVDMFAKLAGSLRNAVNLVGFKIANWGNIQKKYQSLANSQGMIGDTYYKEMALKEFLGLTHTSGPDIENYDSAEFMRQQKAIDDANERRVLSKDPGAYLYNSRSNPSSNVSGGPAPPVTVNQTFNGVANVSEIMSVAKEGMKQVVEEVLESTVDQAYSSTVPVSR